jgi:sugar phosphate isomerase/epimerase
MHNLRIAVATACFRQPLRAAIDTAARCAANGVQLDARNELKPGELGETGRRQLLYELGERDMTVASLTFPLRRSLIDPERIDARIDALRKAMELTAQLKARVLTCPAGRIPRDPESDDYQRLLPVLSDLARYGNHIGVTFSMTPADDEPARLLSLVESIREGPLGVDFDPAGCVLSGQDPGSALRELHAAVSHMQIRDAIRHVDGAGREAPVGRGEVDWELVLALLDEMNYAGWLTVRRTAGDDPAGDCGRAITFLRNVSQN